MGLKKIFILIFLFVSVYSFGQKVQFPATYGLGYQRIGADTLLWIPSDTITPTAQLIGRTHLARKGTTVYYWNGSMWVSLSGGSSKFGKSGEDATPAESRTVDFTSTYDFTLNHIRFGSLTADSSSSSTGYANMSVSRFRNQASMGTYRRVNGSLGQRNAFFNSDWNADNTFAQIAASPNGNAGIINYFRVYGDSLVIKLDNSLGNSPVLHIDGINYNSDANLVSLVQDTTNGTIYRKTISGGGATTLDGLTDVTITSPLNNQSLRYDSVSAQWVNDTAAVINQNLIRDNSIIKYDSVYREFSAVKSDSIRQSFEFAYTTGTFPGDSIMINRSFFNRNVDVHIAGIKQPYDSYDGYTIDDSVLNFHPPLSSGQKVSIITSSKFLNSTIDTSSAYSNYYSQQNGYNNLTFATNTGLVNTSQVFTVTGSEPTGTGLETTYSLGSSQDGRIIMQYKTDALAVVLGFNTTNSEQSAANFEAAVEFAPAGGGALYVADGNGITFFTIGYTMTDGEFVGIVRQGSTLRVQVSKDKIVWKNVYDFVVFSSSAQLYIGADGIATYSAKMYYPQIKTF